MADQRTSNTLANGVALFACRVWGSMSRAILNTWIPLRRATTSTGAEIGGPDMPVPGQKRVGVVVACVVVCVLGGGCSTMKTLRYGVAVVNEGTEKIVVVPFDIGEGPNAMVAVGEVNPGKTAGMSPFYRRPLQTFTVAWRVPSTGANGQVEVKPDLPKEFEKDAGSTMILRIHPEEPRVEVTYEILDPKTGRMNVIRQGDGAGP
jgi:hypothetical protein